jgi:hypothetical protein
MRDFIYLTWLNPLGGFDYWLFTGYKDHSLEVVETGTTQRNVFPGWPKSYGPSADTITKQTFRKTRKSRVIRSQILTATQATELGEQIKSSPLVQIITSRRDRRTVIVDSDSLVVRKESNKVHNLSFSITYTDDYPNQHV